MSDTANNQTPENGIPLTIDDFNEMMRLNSKTRRTYDDPLQGWDFEITNWNQPAPTSFNIDFMAETLWIERGLMLSDIEFIPLGKRPVPETLFIRIGALNEDFQGPAKTLVLHTTGWAQFVETRVNVGRSVAAVEMCIDINSIDVVDAKPDEDTQTVKEA